MSDTQVEITMVQAEDFAVQIFWTDDYNDPIPISDPVLMDVKDGNGQIAMRFLGSGDETTGPRAYINGPAGFIQLTAPKATTAKLRPGRYLFDLWASVADSAAPFDRQAQQVVSGFLLVESRVSKTEDVNEFLTSQGVTP